MKPAAHTVLRRFKTYPIRSGWITVVGDVDDIKALRSLYLASRIQASRREVAMLMLALADVHESLARERLKSTIDVPIEPKATCLELETLERGVAARSGELGRLEREFDAGYKEICWEGRIGPYLLPLEGQGREVAVEIVTSALNDERDTVSSQTPEKSEVDTLRQFAERLQMRRWSIGD